MGQIEKFWCLSDREFPEFFKNGPTFYSSSTQWPSVTIFHKSQFFLGHPVEVRVFVAGAVEKGPGSFRPMGAELQLFKVGVSHFVALDVMQS